MYNFYVAYFANKIIVFHTNSQTKAFNIMFFLYICP